MKYLLFFITLLLITSCVCKNMCENEIRREINSEEYAAKQAKLDSFFNKLDTPEHTIFDYGRGAIFGKDYYAVNGKRLPWNMKYRSDTIDHYKSDTVQHYWSFDNGYTPSDNPNLYTIYTIDDPK